MLIADKAYTHDSTRRRLRRRGIAHIIPERADRVARRAAKGSHGERPPAFDKEVYRRRNVVERRFNRSNNGVTWPPATSNALSTGQACDSSSHRQDVAGEDARQHRGPLA